MKNCVACIIAWILSVLAFVYYSDFEISKKIDRKIVRLQSELDALKVESSRIKDMTRDAFEAAVAAESLSTQTRADVKNLATVGSLQKAESQGKPKATELPSR